MRARYKNRNRTSDLEVQKKIEEELRAQKPEWILKVKDNCITCGVYLLENVENYFKQGNFCDECCARASREVLRKAGMLKY